MTDTLWLDIETYSPVSIKRCGSYRYAENCEIMALIYAYGDEEITVLDVTDNAATWIAKLYDFVDRLRECRRIGAHNGALFDRVVLKNANAYVFEEKNGLHKICCEIRRLVGKIVWYDTMIKAYAHSLPGSLAELSAIFNLPEDTAKDKEGRTLVNLFCKPRRETVSKIRRATRDTHPELWKKFMEYARMDVVAMRTIDKLIPSWNVSKSEQEFQLLDQRMNDRGFYIDHLLAEGAISALTAETAARNSRTECLTSGAVSAATQRDRLLKYLICMWGVELPDMQKSTLTRRLEDPDLPEPVRELIRVRLQSAGTSTKKYERILDIACADGRAHGTMQFHGAWRTGRQGGRLFQPHNLPRPSFSSDEINTGIDAITARCVGLLYPSVVDICASALRGVIIAAPGNKLIVADESSIEGRGLAWLAGEEWKLRAYRDYDSGVSHDMYVLTYARAFNVPPETVDSSKRKLGKVLELAYGYGGGVGASITFANGYGIDLDQMADSVWATLDPESVDDAEIFYQYSVKMRKTYGLSEKTFIACDAIKRMWRGANPRTVDLWKSLEIHIRAVIRGDYPTASVGHIGIDKTGSWLRIRLPSGRYLQYPGIKISSEKEISYLGQNIYSKQWCRIKTYGGKLAENITQAMCYDYFIAGVRRAEKCGYLPVLLVHDEMVAEVPDSSVYTADELCKLISAPPEWAPDFPGAAAGFEAYRYRKE